MIIVTDTALAESPTFEFSILEVDQIVVFSVIDANVLLKRGFHWIETSE